MKNLRLDREKAPAPVVDLSKTQQGLCDCGGKLFSLFVADDGKQHAQCPTDGQVFTLTVNGWQRPLNEQEKRDAEASVKEAKKVDIKEPAVAIN